MTTTTVRDIIPTTTQPRDSDGDGVIDRDDRCPGYPDGDDNDEDGIPDVCDETPICCISHCAASGWLEGEYVADGDCSSPLVEPSPCTWVCRYYYSMGWSWTDQRCCCRHFITGICPATASGCTCPSENDLKTELCPAGRPGTPPMIPEF